MSENIKKELKEALELLNSSINEDTFLNNIKNIYQIFNFLNSINNKEDFEDLTNNYYIPILEVIMKRIPDFINQKKNIFNIDFITSLAILYDGLYIILRNFSENKEINEFFSKILSKYYKTSYGLLFIMPKFDEATTKIYEKENPIIVFNGDENKYSKINFLKGKILQFFAKIMQIVSFKNEEEKEKEDIKYIVDKDLVYYINQITNFIFKSLEDIVNNKEKFLFLRKKMKYKELNNNDDFNLLLFCMFAFLSRSLLREPIKSNFHLKIKKLLFNVLFPLSISFKEELNFLENEPYLYDNYISEISNNFRSKNFRSGINFVVKKIFMIYEDMPNYILSFISGMLNYNLCDEEIDENFKDYNIYLINIKNSQLNNFNDEEKIDLALLIILLFQEQLKNNYYLLNKIGNIFLYHQDKLNLIQSPMVKFKLCKMFQFYISLFLELFSNEADEINIQFIDLILNFLLKNIIQNAFQEKEKYLQILSLAASDTLINLLALSKEIKSIEKLVKEYIEKNFIIFNNLVEIINMNSFYKLMEQIIIDFKIDDRNLLFDCFNNLKNQIIKEGNEINKVQYIETLKSFFTGINKLNVSDDEEIKIIQQFLKDILNYLNKNIKFEYFDELIQVIHEYMKFLNNIDNICETVFTYIKLNLNSKTEKKITLNCFNFLITYIEIYKKNKISDESTNNIICNNIFEIIKESFLYYKNKISSCGDYDDEIDFENCLLLSIKLLYLFSNIDEEILIFLINETFNYLRAFNLNFDNETKVEILQIILCNISIGFIYHPNITFKILNKEFIENNNFKRTNFDMYIHYLKEFVDNINDYEYNYFLGKCLLLGISAIYTNEFCLNYFNDNKLKKVSLLRSYIDLILKHKKNIILFLSNQTKKELVTDFVDENNEDNEETEEEINENFEEFLKKIQFVLKDNDDIINCNEYKLFAKVIKYIKKNDFESYNNVINNENLVTNFESAVEQMEKIQNIKVNYNNKEYLIPRIILKIKIK